MAQKADCTLRSGLFGQPGGGLLPVQRSSEMSVNPVPQEGVFGTEYLFRTESACFLHREPLKTRRVHQEPLYGTARPFRTPGGPLRYRMIPRQKGERPCLRTNFSNCQKREGHCKKRSPECRREQENHSQKVCNAAPKLLSATRKSLYAPKLLSAPRKSDITPLSESKKPISETDRLSGSG